MTAWSWTTSPRSRRAKKTRDLAVLEKKRVEELFKSGSVSPVDAGSGEEAGRAGEAAYAAAKNGAHASLVPR